LVEESEKKKFEKLYSLMFDFSFLQVKIP